MVSNMKVREQSKQTVSLLVVFASMSCLFIPLLVWFENQIQNEVKLLPNISRLVPPCIECCFRKNKTNCGRCDRSDLPCNWETGADKISKNYQHFSKNDIARICNFIVNAVSYSLSIQLMSKLSLKTPESLLKYRGRISEAWDTYQLKIGGASPVKKSLQNSEDTLDRWWTISQTIVSPRLPCAHLFADGQPTNVGRSEYMMKSWQWQEGAKYAYTAQKSMYINNSGILVVPKTGIYNVYIHTTFYKREATTHDWCTLSHQVKRDNQDVLIKASETMKCNVVTGFRKLRIEGETNVGFHTFNSIGTFQLEVNEELSVFYKMPRYVRIGSLDTETYFGIFMV